MICSGGIVGQHDMMQGEWDRSSWRGEDKRGVEGIAGRMMTCIERTQAQHAAETDLSLQGKLGLEDDGKGDGQEHEIRRDIPRRREDHVVVVGRALRVVVRHRPVLVRRRAPVSHEQGDYEDVPDHAVPANAEHRDLLLPQGGREAVVEDQEARLDGPDAGEGKYLQDKGHDASEDGVFLLLRR